MTLWDFLNKNPWWGMVYLVIVCLGVSAASASLGSGLWRRPGMDDTDSDEPGES